MGAWLSGIFGGEKKPSKHDNAVWELKTQRDKLIQYKKTIVKILDREIAIAKQLLKENKKDKAKLALQKKKYQEQLLEKAEIQLDNLKTLIDQLDFAKIEVQVFEGLKAGTKALQQLNNEMKIEDVEKLMDDSREALEYQDVRVLIGLFLESLQIVV
jgi:charged multivesicular body protein 6